MQKNSNIFFPRQINLWPLIDRVRSRVMIFGTHEPEITSGMSFCADVMDLGVKKGYGDKSKQVFDRSVFQSVSYNVMMQCFGG